MSHPKRVGGRGKVVLLSVWLTLPIAIVVLLIWFIFVSFQTGPAMDARAVGQGARDTGGANAIGELLAGNDPDERRAEQRALREGTRIDPRTWAGGARLVITLDPALADLLPAASSIEFVLSPERRLVASIGDGVLIANAPPGTLAGVESIDIVAVGVESSRTLATVRLPESAEPPGDEATPVALSLTAAEQPGTEAAGTGP